MVSTRALPNTYYNGHPSMSGATSFRWRFAAGEYFRQVASEWNYYGLREALSGAMAPLGEVGGNQAYLSLIL
jgi:hypothetical protein